MIQNFTPANPGAEFKGPPDPLSSWIYQLGEGLLEGILAVLRSVTEFAYGVRFWT